jgi:hypothetical protein
MGILRLTALEAGTKRCASLCKDMAAIVVPLSAILGTGLLLAYLRSSSAPFPPLDSSYVGFLLVFTLVFIPLLAVVSVILPLTGAVKMVASSRVKSLLPALFPASTSEAVRLRDYTKSYITFFFPFLGYMVLTGLYLTGETGPIDYGLLFVATSLFCTASSTLAFRRRTRTLCYLLSFAAWSFLASFAAFAFLFFSIHLFTETSRNYVLGLNGYQLFVATFASVALLILLHWLMNMAHVSAKRVLAATAILATFAMVAFPGAPFLGGVTLRLLGVGGNLPISLVVRSIEPNQIEAKAKEVTGCLILQTGQQVILRPAHTAGACRLQASLLGEVATARPHSGVTVYSTEDVLSISYSP